METCLDLTEGPDARVTIAWSLDDGRIGVRTRNIHAAWWLCIASADGESVLNFDPLPQNGPELPREAVVIYTSVKNELPPAGACYQHHQPVHDASGNLVGWLSDLVC
jgi:hypothetical protein